VVEGEEQQVLLAVLLTGQAEQAGAPERRRREVEGAAPLRFHQAAGLVLPAGGRESREIGQREGDLRGGRDPLAEPLGAVGEGGAQGGVAARDSGQGPGQGGGA
jgi:hypothetical protein